jgi:hypothetical protein
MRPDLPADKTADKKIGANRHLYKPAAARTGYNLIENLTRHFASDRADRVSSTSAPRTLPYGRRIYLDHREDRINLGLSASSALGTGNEGMAIASLRNWENLIASCSPVVRNNSIGMSCGLYPSILVMLTA